MTDPIHAQLDALDRLRAEARLKAIAEALTDEPVSDALVARAVAGASDDVAVLPTPAKVEDLKKQKQAEAKELNCRHQGLTVLISGPIMVASNGWIMTQVHGDLGGSTPTFLMGVGAVIGLAMTAIGAWITWGRKRLELSPAVTPRQRWGRRLSLGTGVLLGALLGPVLGAVPAMLTDGTLNGGGLSIVNKDMATYPAQREALRALMGDTDTTVGHPSPERCSRAQQLLDDARKYPASKTGLMLFQAFDGLLATHGCLTPAAYETRARDLQARAHQIVSPTDVVLEPIAWIKGVPSPRTAILESIDRKAAAPMPKP